MSNTERDRDKMKHRETQRKQRDRETEQEAERIWTDTCLAFLKSMTNMNLSIFFKSIVT